MGTKTGISWTDATWNPIRGCSRVSEGCRHCYAESVAYRFSGPGLPYEGLVQLDIHKSGAVVRVPKWNGKIRFVEEHLLDPLRWKKPRRIFVNSMSDLFHENVTDEMRDKIFAVMALCPQHTFQVLTKRPERMLAYIAQKADEEKGCDGRQLCVEDTCEKLLRCAIPCDLVKWPLPNVHLGVSVENQKAADDRLDYLCELASQGWKTMVSFEPLLRAVDPGPWWLSLGERTWAIVGREGGNCAPVIPGACARSLRERFVAVCPPYFFPRAGEFPLHNYH